MILEGVTQGGAVVPVEVTDIGRLVAEGLEGPAGPEGPQGPEGPPGATGSVSAVPAGSAAAPGLAFDGDSDTGIYSPGADQLALSANGAERARIDDSGKLLFGTTVPIGELFGAGINYGATVNVATTADEFGAVFCSYRDTSSYNGFSIAKSRSNTPGGHGLVGPGENVSAISFDGSDGTQFINAGQILVGVDGTPAVGDMAASMKFYTNPGGEILSREVMRLDSVGRLLVGISDAPPGTVAGDVVASGAIVLKSPNGSWWAIEVDDSGNLYASQTAIR